MEVYCLREATKSLESEFDGLYDINDMYKGTIQNLEDELYDKELQI